MAVDRLRVGALKPQTLRDVSKLSLLPQAPDAKRAALALPLAALELITSPTHAPRSVAPQIDSLDRQRGRDANGAEIGYNRFA